MTIISQLPKIIISNLQLFGIAGYSLAMMDFLNHRWTQMNTDEHR